MTYHPRSSPPSNNVASPPRELTLAERVTLRNEVTESSAWMRAELCRRRSLKRQEIPTPSLKSENSEKNDLEIRNEAKLAGIKR